MHTLLATTSSFGQEDDQPVETLRRAGFRLIVNPHGRKLTEAELAELLTLHRPVGLLAGTEPVTRAVLEKAQDHLRAVARVGVGWDNVDRAAAAELGMAVSRTEGVLDTAVAELALGFMLSALRHIARQDRDVRAGVWKKRMGGLLSGKTVGILGYGAIGSRVGGLAAAFGAKLAFCDPAVDACSDGLATSCCLDDLLRNSDILTLHASGSACLIGARELSLCKPGVIVVNTARGGLVDENALLEGLQSGRVGAACLDVFASEPYSGPLTGQENAILTPHAGSYAREARLLMERTAVDNLLADLTHKRNA
ncbi:phosphoglycerate dehydrogenase [Fundidesulfovibrio butyratiphilus]